MEMGIEVESWKIEMRNRHERWIWRNCKQCFNYSVCHSMAWYWGNYAKV